MKNNKGLILSTYVYVLLVFFLLILGTMLVVLNNTKLLSEKIKGNVKNKANASENDFNILLLGEDVITIYKDDQFVDPGYTAKTNDGEELTAAVISNVNINEVGTYTVTYTVNYHKFTKSAERQVKVIKPVWNYGTKDDYYIFTVPRTGWYEVELWGAQGGSFDAVVGGFGGYTKGIIELTQGEKLYIYVGKQGQSNALVGSGGYNGGGVGASHASVRSFGGGGATDVRYFGNNVPSDLSSDTDIGLNSRIMVAGGGGGGFNNSASVAGYGGNIIGGLGTSTNATYTVANYYTNGGGQTAGGVNAFVATKTGQFGMGLQETVGTAQGGGGGGGYYGGAMGNVTGGGGGSSYISGYAGVISVESASDQEDPRTHTTNSTKHYSGKYFINGKMRTGINEGNGKATITYTGIDKPERLNTTLNDVRYIKDCTTGNSASTSNDFLELQAIKDGVNLALTVGTVSVEGTIIAGGSQDIDVIRDGLIFPFAATDGVILTAAQQQCVIIDLGQEYDLDEVAVWHYLLVARTYKENVTSVAGSDGEYRTLIETVDAETDNGKRINAYDYPIKNLVSNPNFLHPYGWSTSNSSVNNTVSGTRVSGSRANGNTYIVDTSTSTAYWNYQPIAFVDGHIYYLSFETKITAYTAEGLMCFVRNSAGTVHKLAAERLTEDFEMFSMRFESAESNISIQVGSISTGRATGYIRNLKLYDLTAYFGAGKEPTQEWCDENL